MSGGSGGGAGCNGGAVGTAASSNQQTFTGYTSYGNPGGIVTNNSGFPSGGGGGAGSTAGSTGASTGGNGGAGILISLTGLYYGGGGGGAATTTSAGTPGTGGSGGGGAALMTASGGNGTPNTGGGGGGSYSYPGGKGGSGVVVISVPTIAFNFSNFSGSGTYTTSISGKNTIITFKSGVTNFTIGYQINVPPIPYYVTPLSSLFTSNTLTISGQPFGNGVYTVTTSGNYDTSTGYSAYNAFNGLKVFANPGTGIWVAGSSNSNGAAATTIVGVGSVGSYWIQLKIPYSLILQYYSLFPWCGNGNNGPVTWYIVGSNDGTTWNNLDYQSVGSLFWNTNNVNLTYFNITNYVSYSYFRMVVISYGGSFCALSQFNIGT